jgi:hypothetical protein
VVRQECYDSKVSAQEDRGRGICRRDMAGRDIAGGREIRMKEEGREDEDEAEQY